jgi:HPt (histidine-containing phosphotransfer) domain-containing protein
MSIPTSEKLDASMAAELDRLWLKYRPVNAARLAAVEAAVAAGSAGATEEPAGLEEGRRAAHKLAGSLGMFDYTRASDLVRKTEQILCSPAPDFRRAAVLVAAIRSEVHLPEVTADAEPAPAPASVSDAPPIETCIRERGRFSTSTSPTRSGRSRARKRHSSAGSNGSSRWSFWPAFLGRWRQTNRLPEAEPMTVGHGCAVPNSRGWAARPASPAHEGSARRSRALRSLHVLRGSWSLPPTPVAVRIQPSGLLEAGEAGRYSLR